MPAREDLETLMEENGYVSAATAAELSCFKHVSSIHKLIKKGDLEAARTGNTWFVCVGSLIDHNSDNPVLVARIKAYGVEPKEERCSSR